ncbi:MAG: hypothetical protein ACF787_02900 [Rhodopirellula sp. JB053]|uniref:hypothetical protein n=1 Tax=Rhodopirellula sp. JB044 TaxID=3342844 RepID=UPI00370C66A9
MNDILSVFDSGNAKLDNSFGTLCDSTAVLGGCAWTLSRIRDPYKIDQAVGVHLGF